MPISTLALLWLRGAVAVAAVVAAGAAGTADCGRRSRRSPGPRGVVPRADRVQDDVREQERDDADQGHIPAVPDHRGGTPFNRWPRRRPRSRRRKGQSGFTTSATSPRRLASQPDDRPGSFRRPSLSNCLSRDGRSLDVQEEVNDVSDPNDAEPPSGKTVVRDFASGAGRTDRLRDRGRFGVATNSPDDLRTNPVVSVANPVTSTFCCRRSWRSGRRRRSRGRSAIRFRLHRRRHDCGDAPGRCLRRALRDPIFHVADAALRRCKIEEVRHNGPARSRCCGRGSGSAPNADGC